MSVSTHYEHLYFHRLVISIYDLGHNNIDQTIIQQDIYCTTEKSMIVQIISNQKCEDCAISTQKYHKSYRMWTCLIKVTFRHQKHIIKMCTKVTVTPCLYICTNLKIAKSYFSCQFMHRKDKFKQSAVPVQNRFVIY